MIFSKFRSMMTGTLAIAAALALQPSLGRTQEQPAAAPPDQAAPAGDAGSSDQIPDQVTTPARDASGAADAPPSADSSATTPAAEPTPDTTTVAPATEPSTGDVATPPPSDGAAQVPPVDPQAPAAATADPATPAAPSESTATATVDASQLKIGTAVFGADGGKIGELNGVKSDGAGKVQQILVTDGVAAGLDAKVFAISADKITSVSDGVKLSLSSDEAKKLPLVGNNNG